MVCLVSCTLVDPVSVKRNVLANQTVYMMPDSHMLWGLFGIREYGLYAT